MAGSLSGAEKYKPKDLGPGPKLTPVRGLWTTLVHRGVVLHMELWNHVLPFPLQGGAAHSHLLNARTSPACPSDRRCLSRLLGFSFNWGFHSVSSGVVPLAARKKDPLSVESLQAFSLREILKSLRGILKSFPILLISARDCKYIYAEI